MKIFIQIGIIFLFTSPVFALEIGESVQNVKLIDQFDKSFKITADTKYILFAAGKKPAATLTDYLNESNFNLAAKNIIYASDISKMPKMITKMLALPEMKKYKFKIALDHSGEETKSWPHDDDHIAVIRINQFKVTEVQYIGSRAEIEKFLKGL